MYDMKILKICIGRYVAINYKIPMLSKVLLEGNAWKKRMLYRLFDKDRTTAVQQQENFNRLRSSTDYSPFE